VQTTKETTRLETTDQSCRVPWGHYAAAEEWKGNTEVPNSRHAPLSLVHHKSPPPVTVGWLSLLLRTQRSRAWF